MEWAHVTVDTVPDGIEALAEQLAAAGYESLEIEDERAYEAFAAQNERFWGAPDEAALARIRGVSRVGMYLENGINLDGALKTLEQKLRAIRAALPDTDFGPLAIRTQIVSDEAWEGKWKAYYRPTPVGERLLILPEWERDADTAGRLPLVLDPGATFGTGTHATTAMCLRLLEAHVRGGERVLDLGCGSGVLSIAALLLGAKCADGVDVDPLAVSVSRENARLNGFGNTRYLAVLGDVCTDAEMHASLAAEPYDLVLANIVADVLIDLAAKVPVLLKAEGRLLCSGIINERADEVIAALEEAGFTAVNQESEDGWTAVLCAR